MWKFLWLKNLWAVGAYLRWLIGSVSSSVLLLRWNIGARLKALTCGWVVLFAVGVVLKSVLFWCVSLLVVTVSALVRKCVLMLLRMALVVVSSVL